MVRSRRTFLALLGAAGLAGCSDPTADPTPTAAEQSTATPTATAKQTETPTETSSPTATASPTATPEPFQASPIRRVAAVDGDDGDRFGSAVAMPADGRVALVGAPGDEHPNGPDGGSAYVIRRSGDRWTQGAKLWAADGTDGDRFGSAVAAARDTSTLVVGAPGSEGPEGTDGTPTGDGTGVAHVFERAGDGWTPSGTLAAADGDVGDHFGATVAVSGDGSTVLVAAPGADGTQGPAVGTVYVFERVGDDWNQRTALTAGEGAAEDRFGSALALSADGGTALVGAPGTDGDTGAAYAVRGSGDDWRQVHRLEAPDGDDGDRFGAGLAMSADGRHAIVGAPRDEDPNGTDAGSVYAFGRSGGWNHRSKLAPEDGDSRDRLGSSVAMSADGRLAVVGAPRDDDPNGQDGGSAYSFRRVDGRWRVWQRLSDITGDAVDYFGTDLDVSDDREFALVGSPNDEDPNGPGAGSGYVFR